MYRNSISNRLHYESEPDEYASEAGADRYRDVYCGGITDGRAYLSGRAPDDDNEEEDVTRRTICLCDHCGGPIFSAKDSRRIFVTGDVVHMDCYEAYCQENVDMLTERME